MYINKLTIATLSIVFLLVCSVILIGANHEKEKWEYAQYVGLVNETTFSSNDLVIYRVVKSGSDETFIVDKDFGYDVPNVGSVIFQIIKNGEIFKQEEIPIPANPDDTHHEKLDVIRNKYLQIFIDQIKPVDFTPNVEMGYDLQVHYVIGQSGNPNLDDNVWFSGRIGHLVTEFYRRKTAKVTFAHQVMNAKAGYSNGGSVPFGYLRREVFVTDESGMENEEGGL